MILLSFQKGLKGFLLVLPFLFDFIWIYFIFIHIFHPPNSNHHHTCHTITTLTLKNNPSFINHS